jgi:hypothetical protein
LKARERELSAARLAAAQAAGHASIMEGRTIRR